MIVWKQVAVARSAKRFQKVNWYKTQQNLFNSSSPNLSVYLIGPIFVGPVKNPVLF